VCSSSCPFSAEIFPGWGLEVERRFSLAAEVSHPGGSIETRSLPTLARCFRRSFTFYVADPVSSIPAGSIQRVCHDTLDFIQVPGYPSAIETRSLLTLTHVLPPISTSRFCPSMSLASPAAPFTRSYPRRFTFYVAWPTAPFARLTHSRRIVVQR
jgi:hypothetical protein